MLDFFFLPCDANRDRTVNLNDFNLLAGNFGLALAAPSTSATSNSSVFSDRGAAADEDPVEQALA